MDNYNIKNISVEISQDYCEIEVERLHQTLLNLPAHMYIELYYYMKDKIENKMINE